MKNVLALLAIMSVLVACENVTNGDSEELGKYFIKDSSNTIVDWGYLNSSLREVSSSDIPASAAEFVETYNDATNDDQYYIVASEDEELPTCNAWIVNEGDYEVLAEYLDIDRSELNDRRAAYRLQAENLGGILFVDKIPPAPVPIVDDRPDYEKYAVYLILPVGYVYNDVALESEYIMYEEHTTADEFAATVYRYEMQAQNMGNGVYVVSGKLYTVAAE